MPYNPDVHHRQSIRWQDRDYAAEGAYFITICTLQKQCLFGDVIDGAMRLNACGEVVQKCWNEIPLHFPNTKLGTSVVMPNHFHGIVIVQSDEAANVGAQHAAPLQPNTPSLSQSMPVSDAPNVKPGSLGAIVRSFKSAVTKRINELRESPGEPVWQRNYYDRVIRDQAEYDAITAYIENNPAKWTEDENYVSMGSP